MKLTAVAFTSFLIVLAFALTGDYSENVLTFLLVLAILLGPVLTTVSFARARGN